MNLSNSGGSSKCVLEMPIFALIRLCFNWRYFNYCCFSMHIVEELKRLANQKVSLLVRLVLKLMTKKKQGWRELRL